MPVIRSDTIGLRLCGIADEPFCLPARNGSSTSRTSVRWRWRISVAKRSSPAPASAIAWSSSAWRSRATTCVDTGSAPRSRRDKHAPLEVGRRRRVGADGAGDRADARLAEGALEPVGVAVGLEREAGELDAERRRLGLDAVRAADHQRVDVLARARGKRVDQLVRAAQDDLARRAQLERERGVEHVRRRQPEVDPAARVARGLGQDVDERGDVVVGDLLALLRRLDGEGRGADRVELGGRRTVHLLARGDLDLPPRLHPRLVGPDGADLGAGVARDHAFEAIGGGG